MNTSPTQKQVLEYLKQKEIKKQEEDKERQQLMKKEMDAITGNKNIIILKNNSK